MGLKRIKWHLIAWQAVKLDHGGFFVSSLSSDGNSEYWGGIVVHRRPLRLDLLHPQRQDLFPTTSLRLLYLFSTYVPRFACAHTVTAKLPRLGIDIYDSWKVE